MYLLKKRIAFVQKRFKNLVKSTFLLKTLQVSMIAIIVKFVTFFKDLYITKYFVFDGILDSFFIGLIIPQFILSVFIYSINSIVVPNYLREQSENPSNIGSFSYTSLILSLITGLLVSIIALFLYENILVLFSGKNSTAEISFLAKTHFQYLIPSVFFSSVTSFIGAIHNAKDKYLLTSITPVITVLTTIISLFFVNRLGIFALSIGFTVGYFIEMLIMIFSVYYTKIPFEFKFKYTKSVKDLLVQSFFKMNASLFAAGVMIVNQIYASMQGEGSLSLINYAQKIPLFINVVVTMSIGITILPYFSKNLYTGTGSYKTSSFIKIILQLFAFSSVISLILILFSEQIVTMLFYRGNIDMNDIKTISKLQIIYFLQVPFYLVAIVSVRLLTSLNKNKMTVYASIASLVIVFLSNEILSKQYGIYGIAFSMLVSVFFNMILNLVLSVKQLKKVNI
jgi:putative peptidoglycan lipid II flippase